MEFWGFSKVTSFFWGGGSGTGFRFCLSFILSPHDSSISALHFADTVNCQACHNVTALWQLLWLLYFCIFNRSSSVSVQLLWDLLLSYGDTPSQWPEVTLIKVFGGTHKHTHTCQTKRLSVVSSLIRRHKSRWLKYKRSWIICVGQTFCSRSFQC